MSTEIICEQFYRYDYISYTHIYINIYIYIYVHTYRENSLFFHGRNSSSSTAKQASPWTRSALTSTLTGWCCWLSSRCFTESLYLSLCHEVIYWILQSNALSNINGEQKMRVSGPVMPVLHCVKWVFPPKVSESKQLMDSKPMWCFQNSPYI